MNIAEKLFGHYVSFQDKDELNYKMIKYYDKSQAINCWRIDADTKGECKSSFVQLPLDLISIETLKTLQIWNKISKEDQEILVSDEEAEKRSVNKRMEEVRAGRRGKEEYAFLPREVPCSECGDTEYIAPSVLYRKIGLSTVEGEAAIEKLNEWLSTHKCSKCAPRRRGRVRNPLYVDIPRSVPCSDCGKDCTLNAKSVYELTKGKKDDIDKYCKEYLCRSCNPDWGSWLKGGKGRKPNPENVGFPKTAKCVGSCGKDIPIVPNHIRGKAAKLGITVDELIGNYRCRSCGGVIPHKKKRKKKNV